VNTCGGCGLRVLSARIGTESVLLDPAPNPNGGYLAYKASSGAWLARPTTIEPPRHPLERTYAPHAPTCSNAPEHPIDPRNP